MGERVVPRFCELTPPPTARGSQEAGFTQPRDHSFARLCSYRFCSRCRPASSGWGGASGRQRDRIWRTETTTEEEDMMVVGLRQCLQFTEDFIYVIRVVGLLSKRLGQPLTKQLLFVSYATTTTNDDTTLDE